MATEIATIPLKTPSLPRAVISALTTTLEWDARRALGEIAGLATSLPSYCDAARRALTPADPRWLSNRLSTLWLSMAVGKSAEQATAWLHETQRLLADIPSDIVGPAIDEAVKASARGFMPSVGEIRAFADPKLQDRKRTAGRLEAMQRAQNGEAPAKARSSGEAQPIALCTPEMAAAIRKEFGI